MDMLVPPALNGVALSASFVWIVACAVVGFFLEAFSSDQRQRDRLNGIFYTALGEGGIRVAIW